MADQRTLDGVIADLRARLTTAETERKKFEEAYWTEVRVCQSRTSALAAAEARVEAADKHLLLAEQETTHGLTANTAFIDQCVKAARAALACPPPESNQG